jgi:hypothetical protein
MYVRQAFDVANNGLPVDVENRHQIRAQVRDIQAATATIQTLIIEASRATG